ncbi:MAG: YgiQ family radical SAM protein [Bacillota bacterium]|nr:YgiQ family radical SAM protein [Bacillota bacterium]
MISNQEFLPVSKSEMEERGWWWYDFLLVTGDAYVDHPSFGTAVIGRVLEAEGYRVAVLAQPDWHSAEAFAAFGKPRLGVLIGAGNLDSMVAHYTAAKKRRSEDFYSPGKKAGLRPDRATIVYSNRAREAFGPEVPIIIGGLEASLRRFAHYDYWEDKVRRSILFDSGADMLVYGMGEYAEREIAKRLKKKIPVSEMLDIAGTAYLTAEPEKCAFPHVELPSFADVRDNKRLYAEATRVEYAEHDPVRGKAMIQEHDGRFLVVNPPAMPLTSAELDFVAELPYTKQYHPMYEDMGGVPAIEEVKFSVIHNRGCFGGCNFCALAFHQGRMVTSRSQESVIREVTALTKFPDFKGYINDVGGPSANFRHHSCKKQAKCGMCADRRCLAPTPCPNLDADHSDYLQLLRKLRAIPGIKKVFVRSGIRYDYMLEDKSNEFFSELVKYHISGQLKVAPEHCIDSVLDYMGKPHIDVYERFMAEYKKLNSKFSKEQYVVPYLMSSHPGSTLESAVALAEYLNKMGRQPEQVQDFYPTPGTISTCMYYTEIDPTTMKHVYVAKSFHEKAMQRALLQWKRPDKRKLVMEALKEAGREDLIGYGPECLVKPDSAYKPRPKTEKKPAAAPEKPKKPVSKKGWAKPKPKKNTKPNSKKRG